MHLDQKLLRPIIHAALLMPNIKYYSGNLSSTIMTVAETSNVKQMPNDDEERDALASWLNKEINNARYQLKKTIAESLTPGNELKNIAVLTDRLISKLGKQFNATLSIYLRVAFIGLIGCTGISAENFPELERSGPVVPFLDIIRH
ncbi:hypothetical protein R3P38DRAFT_2788468 [Favolaschia claudopus]|uniref:Uncharacterized protein n=1 Tax=Favolaschia claudopus TaxID=2862362 RepID=A0AAW0AL71_9AGAR